MLHYFDNYRLSSKMLVAFAVIGLLLATVAGLGIYAIDRIGAVATQHVERGIAGTEALGRLVSSLREHRIIIWSQMSASSPAEEQSYAERFAKNEQAIAQAITDYAPLAGQFAPQLALVKADVAALDNINQRSLDTRRNQGVPAALILVKGVGKTTSQKAIAGAEGLIGLQQQRAKASNAAGQALESTVFYGLLALACVALAMLAGIWRLIGLTVARPMAELSSVTTTLAGGGEAIVPHRNRGDELGQVANAVEQFRMAAVHRAETDARIAAEQSLVTRTLSESLEALTKGDLTAEIVADYPSGYVALKSNFNNALGSLRALIGAVMESTLTIKTGSTEIAQASEDLARRTESNAASLEETSAAVAQMDARLRATVQAASQTVTRADQAIATVGDGRAVADDAVLAMNRVSDSAKGIDGVIEGLDKIAFQTRVLAMNAAVEAGRAGDAGRGFAVVADLVSALAMRAEEEAGRARDQLTATQTDIVAAVDMVRQVDGALSNISSDVAEVHGLLGQMAADNQVLSTAITQINVAIGTMDQSTQQNAAMVEETSAAARNLSSEVGSLAEQAGSFDIGGTAAEMISAARPTKPRRGTQSGSSRPSIPTAAILQIVSAGGEDWASF